MIVKHKYILAIIMTAFFVTENYSPQFREDRILKNLLFKSTIVHTTSLLYCHLLQSEPR